MPAKGSPCSSSTVKVINIVLESAKSFGAYSLQDFFDRCPGIKPPFIALIYAWYSNDPAKNAILAKVLNPETSIDVFEAFVDKYPECG